MEGIDFMVDPDVQDLDVTLEIIELTPANLSGGKQLISTIANTASTRDVTGTGVIPAQLEITEAPLYDFGTLINSQTTSFTLMKNSAGKETI